jgi:hypothetical protein
VGLPRGRGKPVGANPAHARLRAARGGRVVAAVRPAVATWTHVGGHGSASGTRGLFNAINKADTVKLILLAIFIAAATIAARRLQAFPRWVLWEGIIAVPVLVLGGLAFVIEAAALDLFLALSLVLVVVWAAAASITILRRVTPRQVSMP